MFPRTEKSNSSKDFSARANIEEPRYVTLSAARRPGAEDFPLIAYDLAKPLQLRLLDPERLTKNGGRVTRRSSI